MLEDVHPALERGERQYIISGTMLILPFLRVKR